MSFLLRMFLPFWVLSLSGTRVNACLCREIPSLTDSLERSDVAVRVRVESLVQDARGFKLYQAYVQRVFQFQVASPTTDSPFVDDCRGVNALLGTRRILIRTGSTPATCGVTFPTEDEQEDSSYLLFGSLDSYWPHGSSRNFAQVPILNVDQCQAQTKWSEVSRSDRRFLIQQKRCRCQQDACGPPPPVAPFQCPDGNTIVGGVGPCVFDRDVDRCAWGPGPTCPTCESDTDCNVGFGSDGGNYCAGGTCLPKGTCANTHDCFNPSNDFPSIQCTGYMYCEASNNECTVQCITENEGEEDPCECPIFPCPDPPCKCPEVVQCFADPCDSMATVCPEATSCFSYYCGGCNAVFYDAAGEVVCPQDNNKGNEDPPGETATCTYKGATYKDGESFPDVCNECFCKDGDVSCTDLACSCEYKGTVYPDGQVFGDDCNTCNCRDGMVACTKILCPTVCPSLLDETCVEECEVAADCRNEDELCCRNGCGHVCVPGVRREDDEVACTYKGSSYPAGASFADDCNTCFCDKNGLVSCTEIGCLSTCPTPEEDTSGICVELCSIPSDCEEEGQLCCSNGCGHVCVDGVPP